MLTLVSKAQWEAERQWRTELLANAKGLGLSIPCIRGRVALGWDLEKACTTPKGANKCSCPIGTTSGRLVTIDDPVGQMVLCRCECGAECYKTTATIVAGRIAKCQPQCPVDKAERKAKRKEKQRINNRNMRERRREELRSRLRKWKQDNPGLVAAYEAKRRAASLAKMALPEPERKAINAIYRISKSHAIVPCYICGKDTRHGGRHVDHVVPVSRGGEHVSSNLAIACAFCNLSKHDRLLEEVA